MGRIKVPEKIIKKRGNYKAHLHKSPKTKEIIPRMPSSLSKIGKQCWKHITKELKAVGLISTIDKVALHLLCDSYAIWMDANTDIRTNGYMIMGAAGRMIVNPAIRLRNEAQKQIQSMLMQFGMTPSSRTGLGGKAISSDTSALDKILGIEMIGRG